MLALRKLLLLSCVLSLTLAKRARPGSSCSAPGGQKGKCVLWSDCAPLANIMRIRPVRKENVLYTQRFNCGYLDRAPFLCCVQGSSPPLVISTPPPAATTTTRSSVNVREKAGNDWGHPLNTHPKRNLLPMNTCGIQFSDYIVGGLETELGEFPWLALIGYTNGTHTGFKCGGSLITSRYVLTAAHCLHPHWLFGYTPLKVRLGDHDTRTNPDFQLNKKSRQKIEAPPFQEFGIQHNIHESYVTINDNQHHDIALIRLDRDAQLNAFVKPICLPTPEIDESYIKVNQRLIVAGWGSTDAFLYRPSDVKMKVEVPVKDIDYCKEIYGRQQRELIETQICAGGEWGKDSCVGDSGGPLMTTGTSSLFRGIRYFAMGIVSYGSRFCATGGVPAIYTRVVPYVSWILDHIEA